MSDRLTLLRRASSLDVSPQFEGYSKVIINISDDSYVSAGNDLGRTLEFDNPMGTKEMAESILAKLQGYQYQPFKAEGALLDPAAEIGDGISVKDIYGGIYKRSRNFGRLMSADIQAPHDEEIDHEFQYESPTERKYRRDIGRVSATLLVQSDQIAARVEKRGGDAESFGWELLADRFSLFSDRKEVFRADKDGVEVSGRINVTSGTIGSGSSGFTVSATAIYNGITEFGGTQSYGIYLGTDGIQLGKNFKVDATGNLTAASGVFEGNVYAKNIQYGAGTKFGTMGGGGITPHTIGTDKTTSPLTLPAIGGISGGTNFNLMDANSYTARYIKGTNGTFTNVTTNSLNCSSFSINTAGISLGSIVVDGVTHHVLKW